MSDFRPLLGGQICPHCLQFKKKTSFSNSCISRTKLLRYILLGHYLGKLNFKPTFEQVTPSRSSGKRLGADLPPFPRS